ASLDASRIGDHSRYTGEIAHQLSTELGGLPVYLSNSTGIRYVVLLSKPPKLPRRVDLPTGIPHGQIGLGVRFTGEPILLDWERAPHMAVLGQTGSGKSVFLRSLVYQAIRDDIRLLLADIDQTTFGMLDGHPALLAPLATTPQAAADLIRQAIGECDHRAALYKAILGHPEKLSEYNALAVKHGKEPLPRLLVILDEASAVLAALGGGRSDLGQSLSVLGWRGRKFGVHFVFAAQEFTKDLIGPVREQVSLSVCFRVRGGEMAKRMGCQGAHRIPEGRAGLAITDRFGPMQAYFVDKSLLMPSSGSAFRDVLDPLERGLFSRALTETDGKLPLAKIEEWGMVGSSRARALQEAWALRGWLAKDPDRDNAFCLTDKAKSLLLAANQQAQQTAANRSKPDGVPHAPTDKPA
ncbi:MAG: hypothetical protein C0409_14425, partial [Novosphingobium sp.]|nr:hypothetical protein [Novosphingobium sp.]